MQELIYPTYMRFEWSSTSVRFNEDLQLVDLLDILTVVYKSESSASTSKTKWFGKEGLQRTCKELNIPSDELVYSIRWKGQHRARDALKMPVVKKFLDVILKHMPQAKVLLNDMNSGNFIVDSPVLSSDEDVLPCKRQRQSFNNNNIVVIYALVYIPTGKRVYTGRTKDPRRRLQQHASCSSTCRLVRERLRKHGRSNFTLEPIMYCSELDADANESYWILKNNTMYPEGDNLRHGSAAGDDENTANSALVNSCTGLIAFEGIADEARACSEAWADFAEIMEGLEDTRIDTDAVCKEILLKVHPDRGGPEEKSYSSHEVAAMINSVRATLS